MQGYEFKSNHFSLGRGASSAISYVIVEKSGYDFKPNHSNVCFFSN